MKLCIMFYTKTIKTGLFNPNHSKAYLHYGKLWNATE